MPPRLRTDGRYKLMVDGVVVATGTLQELGHGGDAICEFTTSLCEPEVTMPFEEIFTDESKRIGSEKEIPS